MTKSEWELRTTRLLQQGIPLQRRSLSEQRSLPQSKSDPQDREAVSSHVGDAIREDMALRESIIKPGGEKKRGGKVHLSLLGEAMNFLQSGPCDATFEDPVVLLCVDIQGLFVESAFLSNLVSGSCGEVWRRSRRLGIVEVVGWRLVLLLVVLGVVVVRRRRWGLFAS